ncbi:MAG: hypothetical protein L6R19_10480 [Alphaproteobacteria bacterium]|nr:hypothetical protein [Alphaproteobacteria bacterium]
MTLDDGFAGISAWNRAPARWIPTNSLMHQEFAAASTAAFRFVHTRAANEAQRPNQKARRGGPEVARAGAHASDRAAKSTLDRAVVKREAAAAAI